MSAHSHANAQNLSGAIFVGIAGEMCRKKPARGRIALRGPAGVPVSSVMLNQAAQDLHA